MGMSSKTPAPQAQFVELINNHRGIILKVAGLWCFTRDNRDELAQEILLAAWRSFPSWDSQRKFSTWLYRIALNVAISDVRKSNRRRRVSVESGLDQLVDPNEFNPHLCEEIDEVYRFVASLEPLNWSLMLLYLEDHSYREMSEVLGITESNVATKINRLKSRMKERFNPQNSSQESVDGIG
jgi:RNA polymerase sigma-70 factor, ECF subfamily